MAGIANAAARWVGRAFVAAWLGWLAPASAQQPQPQPTKVAGRADIIGIAPGQTASDVIAALGRYDAKRKVDVQTRDDGSPYAAEYTRNDWDQDNSTLLFSETIQIRFSSIDTGNRAFWIERSLYYNDAARVATDPLAEALLRKYGKPSQTTGLGAAATSYAPGDKGVIHLDWAWVFGEDGRQLPNFNAQKFYTCNTDSDIGHFAPDCWPLFVYARVNADQGLASSVKVRVVDSRFAMTLNSFDASLARRRAQAQADQQATRNNTPPNF